jgi:hypothetical protein
MNIAFPALVVFLLALPGIIFNYAAHERELLSPVYRLPLSDEIAQSAVFAAVLNILWCWLITWAGYEIVFEDVLILLTGGSGLPPLELSNRYAAIARHPDRIASYFLGLYLASALVGLMTGGVIRRFHLDLRFKFLRIDNPWHYMLNGEQPLFQENRKAYAEMWEIDEKELKRENITVSLSCVVTHGSHSFVYEGIPFDYHLDRSGNLERIILEFVTYQKLYDFSSPGRAPEDGRTAVRPSAPDAIPSPTPYIIESLFAPGRFINISKFPPGMTVSDPYTGEFFKVPPWAEDSGNVMEEQSPLWIAADIFILDAADIHNLAIEYFLLPKPEEPSEMSEAEKISGSF